MLCYVSYVIVYMPSMTQQMVSFKRIQINFRKPPNERILKDLERKLAKKIVAEMNCRNEVKVTVLGHSPLRA